MDHEGHMRLYKTAIYVTPQGMPPGVPRWIASKIGLLHHRQSRLPFYRLPEILREHPQIVRAQRLTMLKSLRRLGKLLWDQQTRRLNACSVARKTGRDGPPFYVARARRRRLE